MITIIRWILWMIFITLVRYIGKHGYKNNIMIIGCRIKNVVNRCNIVTLLTALIIINVWQVYVTGYLIFAEFLVFTEFGRMSEVVAQITLHFLSMTAFLFNMPALAAKETVWVVSRISGVGRRRCPSTTFNTVAIQCRPLVFVIIAEFAVPCFSFGWIPRRLWLPLSREGGVMVADLTRVVCRLSLFSSECPFWRWSHSTPLVITFSMQTSVSCVIHGWQF